jgi:hypothetical protein
VEKLSNWRGRTNGNSRRLRHHDPPARPNAGASVWLATVRHGRSEQHIHRQRLIIPRVKAFGKKTYAYNGYNYPHCASPHNDDYWNDVFIP